MEKEFVPYELAVKLKELGFDEPCFGFWSKIHGLFITTTSGKLNEDAGECLAPTFSQVFRFFREKHGIWVTFEYDDCDCVEANICWYVGKCFIYGTGPLFLTNELGDFRTFEEAEFACLNKLIEIVESKSE